MKKIEPTGANGKKLNRGLIKIALGILLMFVGPVVLYSSFKNEGHPLYYPVLIFGIMVCIYACFLFFTGLKTFVKGIFND